MAGRIGMHLKDFSPWSLSIQLYCLFVGSRGKATADNWMGLRRCSVGRRGFAKIKQE